ncbi:hypothetical protein BDV06DRAFT_31003 [Aspergillus oleicola]
MEVLYMPLYRFIWDHGSPNIRPSCAACIFHQPSNISLPSLPLWARVSFMNLSQASLPTYFFCIFASYIVLSPASKLEEPPFSDALCLPSPAFIYLVLHFTIMSGFSFFLWKNFIHPFSSLLSFLSILLPSLANPPSSSSI